MSQFFQSKSGHGLLLFLAFSAIVSAGVAYQFHQSSLETFQAQKAEEKTTALRLIEAFVTNYSTLRFQLGSKAPVPATFRAHSIESFNKQVGSDGTLQLRWVGREGRFIVTPPADPDMARSIEAFAASANLQPETTLKAIDGRLVLRTVYPSLAREQSCVSCHNELQPDKIQWNLNDVMGAFAIDVPVEPFLATARSRSLIVGFCLFAALAAVGLVISILHFRQASVLSLQNLIFKTALDNMGEGLCMFDADKRLVVCNERYANLYQLPPDLLAVGSPHREIITHRVSQGILKGDTTTDAVEQKISALGQLPAEATSSRIEELADGRLICVTRQPMSGGGWVATHHDITEQRRSEAKIEHMALHDALTGLPNRIFLNQRLEKALQAARQSDQGWAVLMLDLDRFKEVNDALGHPVGDGLLKAVAERLRGCVRENDLVARLGGDEFAILQSLSGSPLEAEALARRILEVISTSFDVDGHQMTIGTSIGIALASQDGTQPDQLVKNADLALYRAKSEGRGNFHFFEPEMDERMRTRRNLEQDLRGALTNNEFELYYQPLVNLEHNSICGFEALLRWNRPGHGRVSPADFIPLAEETGLIIPIGEWVLRQACAQASSWPDHVKIAVNVSAAQFKNRGFVQSVVSALAASELHCWRLELEITESVVLEDSKGAFATLSQLHELGVRIALDDFGTGYSSLTNLRKFPFDRIKIDRSFVMDMSATNPNALAIVRSIAHLGFSLGMATTVEGVETKEQLDQVRAEGCTEIQGYYFSPPRPAHEIAEMIATVDYKAATAA